MLGKSRACIKVRRNARRHGMGHQDQPEKRMHAEAGANADKMRIAANAKKANLDAIHDTVHEIKKMRLVTDVVSTVSISVISLTRNN